MQTLPLLGREVVSAGYVDDIFIYVEIVSINNFSVKIS